VKWKLEIEMKLLGKNGIRIEIEIFFKMEITLFLKSHALSWRRKVYVFRLGRCYMSAVPQCKLEPAPPAAVRTVRVMNDKLQDHQSALAHTIQSRVHAAALLNTAERK